MHKVKKQKAPAVTVSKAKNITLPPLEAGKRFVLNIINANMPLPNAFSPKIWQEVKAAKDKEGALPIDFTELGALPDACVDAIYNAGSLSYLYAHEVIPSLKECYRILRMGGTFMFSVSDLQKIGQALAQGKPEREIYRAPAGSITALDLLYGHRTSIMNGRFDLQIKTGFSASSIAQKLTPLGFGEVEVRRDNTQLHVVARKIDANPKDKPLIRIHEEDMNEMMRKRDNIDRNPEWMKITPEGEI
jgi:SAM-dependent methyltransferase